MKTKILIVEDDRNIRLGLVDLLEGEGFVTVECARGDLAAGVAALERPDLLILDVMLPGQNGYVLCARLRKDGVTAPILMLTAKGQEADKVIGLDAGADDYLTKPFGVRELVARVRALLRRREKPLAATQENFVIGSSTIDPLRLEARRDGQVIGLTARELNLLVCFARHRGEVLSRDVLLNQVWGMEYYGTTRTLDQTMVQLRKKLGEDGVLLATVHGVGYRLVSPS